MLSLSHTVSQDIHGDGEDGEKEEEGEMKVEKKGEKVSVIQDFPCISQLRI